MNIRAVAGTCLDEARLADIAETGLYADSQEESHARMCELCRSAVDRFRENSALLERLKTAPPQQPVLEATGPTELPTPPPGYRLVRQIGRGGQGVVYEGMQESTKRRVAIKALPVWGLTERELARVQREAELVASLNHPGIVAVFEGETLPGGGYALVMEYVEGVPLNRWRPGGQRPDSKRSAAIIATICAAVHHAHERGVIHRDLKPSNILVDAQGAPHVLDFGIARRLASEGGLVDARTTIPALTPQYASPEQCTDAPTDIRTDVYSLGVILYEMLCDRLPYPTHESPLQMARIVATTEAVSPRSIGVRLDKDLETIVLKALQKDPERRYRSAASFADDLERYRAGDAIIARHDNTWYRLRKTVSRHAAAFALGFASLLALIAFAVYETRVNARLTEALSKSNIDRGRNLARGEKVAEAERLLWGEVARLAPAGFDPERSLFASTADELRCYWSLWEMYHRSPCLATVKKDLGILGVLFGDDSAMLRCLRRDGSEVFLTVPDGEVAKVSPAPAIDYEPGDDVHYSGDRRLKSFTTRHGARLVEAATGRELAKGDEPTIERCTGIKLSPDGSCLAVTTVEGDLELYDTATMFRTHNAEDKVLRPSDGAQDHRVPLTFSPDGLVVAAPLEDLRIGLWDVRTGRRAATVGELIETGKRTARTMPDSLAFSHDGKKLAISRRNAEVRVWDIANGVPVGPFSTRAGDPMDVLFSPDDTVLIASDSWGNAIRLFDLKHPGQLAAWHGHGSEIRNADASHDGAYIASVDADELIKFWPGKAQSDFRVLAPHGSHVETIALSHDGSLLAMSGRECVARIVHMRDGSTVWKQPEGESPLVGAAFLQDDRTFAALDTEGVLTVRALPQGETIFRMGEPVPDPAGVHVARCGTVLAVSPEVVLVWEPGEPAPHRIVPEEPRTRFMGIVTPRDSNLFGILAVIDKDKHAPLKVYDCGNLTANPAIIGAERGASVASLGPRNVGIAWSDGAGTIHLTGPASRSIVLSGAEGGVRAIDWHPSGRIVVLGEQVGRLTLWDSLNGNFLAEIDDPVSQVGDIAFTPDGKSLVFAALDGEVRCLDLTLAARCIAGNWNVQMGLGGRVPAK